MATSIVRMEIRDRLAQIKSCYVQSREATGYQRQALLNTARFELSRIEELPLGFPRTFKFALSLMDEALDWRGDDSVKLDLASYAIKKAVDTPFGQFGQELCRTVYALSRETYPHQDEARRLRHSVLCTIFMEWLMAAQTGEENMVKAMPEFKDALSFARI